MTNRSEVTVRAKAVDWVDGTCVLLDQTKLPSEVTYLSCSRAEQVILAIQKLAVRGAPAIGIAGAFAVVLAAKQSLEKIGAGERQKFFEALTEDIASSRPTAVNLRWAIQKMRALVTSGMAALDDAGVLALTQAAKKIHEDDIAGNREMGRLGSELLSEPTEVMTYCNTGDLATGGIGTAFGVIHTAFRAGKITRVYPCETRPVGQGLRLTVWELNRNAIPYTLICDNMAALTMRKGRVGAVFVGADRIAANGDAANKVGTYSLAVLAKHHSVPFYVVAPCSTFDLSISSGEMIPIEERSGEEIFSVLGGNRHPYDVPVHNPAFDVTPNRLITAIVCEKGIIRDPETRTVKNVLGET